jgi:hypothetical protein
VAPQALVADGLRRRNDCNAVADARKVSNVSDCALEHNVGPCLNELTRRFQAFRWTKPRGSINRGSATRFLEANTPGPGRNLEAAELTARVRNGKSCPVARVQG